MEERLLSIVENEVQIAALTIFAGLYALKLRWLLSRPSVRDLAQPKGSAGYGVAAAFSVMFRPWAMPSTRQHWVRWLEFSLLHVGIGTAILYSFLIPYVEGILEWPGTRVAAVAVAVGFGAGVVRLVRRVASPDIRVISSPDDYFSLAVVDIFLLLGVFALCDLYWGRLLFFALTALLLVYVPTSKISHYLYWPFARVFYGAHFGRRAVVQ
ncbi:MAG: hypothetical protein AB1446_06210 [Bacillota bacterium]